MSPDPDSPAAREAARIAALPYRPCVGIMLLDGRGRVFVARRIDTSAEAWQMPQGGIDPEETPVQAAWREMEEEIGTSAATLLAESRDWLRYDLPHALVPRVWRGRFRGQEQKWFAFRFDGRDEDINLQTAHPEFHAWKWIERAELPRLIVPFKRAIYQQVIDEFAGV